VGIGLKRNNLLKKKKRPRTFKTEWRRKKLLRFPFSHLPRIISSDGGRTPNPICPNRFNLNSNPRSLLKPSCSLIESTPQSSPTRSSAKTLQFGLRNCEDSTHPIRVATRLTRCRSQPDSTSPNTTKCSTMAVPFFWMPFQPYIYQVNF